jgi:predicted nucleic acid-binding Zn ribbon protein
MKRVDSRSRLNKTICLKDEMESFMKHIGLDEKLQDLKILDAWKESVGTVIAGYSAPVHLKKSNLFVRVENAVWRFELAARKEEIIAKLNKVLDKTKKKKLIKDIVFI